MNTQHTSPIPASGPPQRFRRLASLMAAFLATMVSLPAHAVVTFPDTPLQSGTPFPSPNITFILDNSGSMALVSMPFDVEDFEYNGNFTSTGAGQTGLNDDPHDRSYLNNTIYYDPSITYKTWLTSNGTTRLAGGTSINSVYANWNLANGASFSTSPTIAGTRDLRNNTESIFYVPKSGITASTNPDDFDRYRVNAAGQVVVAVYTRTQITGFPHAGLSSSSSAGNSYNITVPANATKIETNTTGGGTRVDLRIVDPSANTQCQSKSGNNAESCSYTIPTSTPGTWQIQVRRDGTINYSGVTVDAYITTVAETLQTPPPVTRSQTDELTNIATWYSYYRTRIKTAKGGASEAFGKLGSNYRVGFTAINTTTPGLSAASSSSEVIPTVGTFTSTNKINWFSSLTSSQVASGSTPLRTALWNTGAYYTRTDDHGPWGPAPQISCRQSFAILTTDGFWNGSGSSAGDSDATAGTAIISKDLRHSFTYTPANPYKDNFSTSPNTRGDTLADVANYYWKQDLRTALDNDVPTSDPNTEYWQHMVTFSVAIGLSGTLDPTTDLPGITAGSVHWPDPTLAQDESRIDDLWHAAVNGHGSFVSASNPTAFAAALSSALGQITALKGSGSNVSTNSTSFQTDTRVYQARYLSVNWTGELAAYSASSAGVNATPAWQASQLIPAYATRQNHVFTWNPSGSPKGRAFPAALTAAELLTLDASGRLIPATGAQNAAYIAGDTSLEDRNNVGDLRNRQIKIQQGGGSVLAPTVLGDIIDSTPFFVQELQTMFVGSNDGMLHAFDAVTGVEKFAYIPGSVSLANLATLSDPDYGSPAVIHRYFVDGPVVVSTTLQTPLHNYLVGALGRGGHGVFGLEVTTPNSFSNANVLWESESWASAPDKADMGNVIGEPLIVTLNDVSNTKAVIVSNGANSANAHAVLFIMNLATGAVIKKLDAGANLGLSAPRGWDNDGNGTVDFVYAGDLNGNVWKFDLQGTTVGVTQTTGWQIALSGAPFYVARDPSNNRQPITAGLALAKEPVTGHRWVFVGTGKFLENADLNPTLFRTQSMYGLIDDDGTSAVTGRTSGGDGTLQQRSISVAATIYIDVNGDGVANSADGTQRDVRGFDAPGTLDVTKKGWYIDLLTPPSATQEGERIVSNPRVFGTVLVTASLFPPTPNSCDAGGSGFINALNAFTGTSLPVAFFNANLTMTGGVANFTDDTLSSGTIPIGSVDLGLGMPTLPTMIDNLLVAGGSQGTIGSVAVNPQGPGARRVSWREIEKD